MAITKVGLFIFSLIFFLSGCATTGKDLEMDNQKMRTQVIVLENIVKEKDLEIESLEIELDKAKTQSLDSEKKPKERVIPPANAKREVSAYNIQLALKNAGFDPGSLDGKIGKKTRKAIRDFQKSQGLTPDGIMGNATWEKLKNFLDKEFK